MAMGLDTWSRLFYLVHGPVTALLEAGQWLLKNVAINAWEETFKLYVV